MNLLIEDIDNSTTIHIEGSSEFTDLIAGVDVAFACFEDYETCQCDSGFALEGETTNHDTKPDNNWILRRISMNLCVT